MNLTEEQKKLLKTLVQVYEGGCQSEFLVVRTLGGSALLWLDRCHPNVEINYDDTDFQRLAKEDFLDLRRNSQGNLIGKPTALGIETVTKWSLNSLGGSAKAVRSGGKTKVFIGHGHSGQWKDLKDFLQDRLHLDWEEYNREEVAGYSRKERLKAMLDNIDFAFLVLTADDEQSDGTRHARQNVIHETGLFQGRLGFEKAIVLLEEGCSEFSNIEGLEQIRFPQGNITAVSERIRRVLEREGLIASHVF